MDGQEPHGVAVEGRGSVQATPDAARIVAGVDVVKKDLAAARAEAASRATAVIEAAKSRGIPAADLRTARFSVRVERDYGRAGTPVTGYGVSNRVTVVVRDLDRLGAVLDDVIAAGANDVAGPEFFLHHPEDLEDEARLLAVADARRKAGVLAEAADAALGEIESIAELPAAFPMPRAALARTALAEAAPTPVEAGTEEIAIAIRARWGLVPR